MTRELKGAIGREGPGAPEETERGQARAEGLRLDAFTSLLAFLPPAKAPCWGERAGVGREEGGAGLHPWERLCPRPRGPVLWLPDALLV